MNMKPLFYILLLSLTQFFQLCSVEPWETADTYYEQAENATTILEREDLFNRALEMYRNLEETYKPTLGNGKLYYNIANSYYQLEEYPSAAFYYYRALDLAPNDPNILKNLNLALAKLGTPVYAKNSANSFSFFLHQWLSLPSRLQLFFSFSVILFLLLSASIWNGFRYVKVPIVIIGIIWIALLSGLIYTRYFAPLEVVTLKSSLLYQDAGEQYATVSNVPVTAGSKLQVLEVLDNGKWIKVITPKGEIGYIIYQKVKML